MNNKTDSNRNARMPTDDEFALVKSGNVTSLCWMNLEDIDCDPIRFQVFRTDPNDVKTVHGFTPSDLPDVVRVVHFLAFFLSGEEYLEAGLRDDLACLASCLDDVMPSREWSFTPPAS